MSNRPVDDHQRQQALDVTGSFIVQAPAGSGKTELLIQRILALLATAGTPEEILGITFTRKAAAEMHRRLFDALKAAEGPRPLEEHAAQTWELARAALARDRQCGWNLFDSPARLQVMTIDSFNSALVRRMPWLSRFGEVPAIAEEPADLYRAAAERLLARLDRGGEGSAAIERLLAHLDNRLTLLRDLLVAMLGRRDQWLRHLDPANLAVARPELENALHRQVADSLSSLLARIDADLLTELCGLGAWAAGNLATDSEEGNPLASLSGRTVPPSVDPADLPAWLALTHLVLTKEGGVRSSITKSLGFPPGKGSPEREMKERLTDALDRLRGQPAVVEGFVGLRHLPATAYDDAQWAVLSALVELLPLANRELREVFRGEGSVDFTEIARSAIDALGESLAPSDLMLHLDSAIRHILVDEFQDTSRGQYLLLSRLTEGWEEGDGRTLYVVGDPMQSIYRFREAEVGLFLRTRARGLGDIRLAPLTLRANFRSRAGLVDWFNATFAALFPVNEDEMLGAVPYADAAAVHPADPDPAVTLTCFEDRQDAAEAAHIVELIRRALAADDQATVAVLVRARTYLGALVPALKAAGIPWQAQEIDPLASRPAVRDLVSLTRALLHPADRVAWLATLRAPWCGLALDDLLALCGSDGNLTVWESLTGAAGQAPLLPVTSTDGWTRLEPVVAALGHGLSARGRVPLRRLVESTWLALNGPAGLTAGDLADAGQFFALLEELDEGGDLARLEILEERLGKLFAAPDPQPARLQLMTIHKAKGLEFDTVILPGLGRKVRPPDRQLLLWQERPDPQRRQEGLLLAPIPAAAGEDSDPTWKAISRIHAERERMESLRLFYVAATRARRRLHLCGHVKTKSSGEQAPPAGSLLGVAWPVLSSLARFVSVPPESAADAAQPLKLRRLPAGWSAPPLAPSLSVAVPETRRPSDGEGYAGHAFSLSLRTEEGRVVGTVVHEWLERFANDGPDAWPQERVQALASSLQTRMLAHGVPKHRAGHCAERALNALTMTLQSSRGRWILGAHRDASCELALSGVIDGVVVTAVIDRTFIDEEGTRWIIDYKTGMRGEDETPDEFFSRERERYRAQLNDYRTLMTNGNTRVKSALYFPLLDAWCEMD